MHVNQYDIVLDVLIVNQTSDTLQSVSLELATLGTYLNMSLHVYPHVKPLMYLFRNVDILYNHTPVSLQ